MVTDGPVELLTQYWDHLENDEWEAAAARFAEDCAYFHPPIHEGIDAVYGRDNLVTYFREARGPRNSEHIVDHTVVEGDSAVVMGRAVGPDVDGVHVFGVYVTAGPDGISYYSSVNREHSDDYSLP